MEITFTIEILCKPEDVFLWIDDPEKAKHWQKNIKNYKILHETAEKIGTTFEEEIEENGKSLLMVGEITAYVKNKSISFSLESKIHRISVIYYIQANQGGSLLTAESKVYWKFPMSFVSKLIGKKIKSNILQQLKMEFEDLKGLCEANCN